MKFVSLFMFSIVLLSFSASSLGCALLSYATANVLVRLFLDSEFFDYFVQSAYLG